MTDPRDRLFAGLFFPWSFVLGAILTLIGFMSAYHWGPELSERYLAFWSSFVILTAFGIAVGTFEITSGLSPEFQVFAGSGTESRFYADRRRGSTVGWWRIVSCSLANIVVFVMSRVTHP